MFLLRFEVGDQFWLIGEGICKSSLTVLPSAEIGESGYALDSRWYQM
jgi:hypothetical protein